MPRQYKPFNLKINNIPLIVYPVKDENPLREVFKDTKEIIEHIKKIYSENAHVNKGSYHILFIWNLNGERMTDIWIHDMKNWSDSGPLLECHTFRDVTICEDAGIASGDSIIVLGREEELRRKSKSIEDYYDRTKTLPDFPNGMRPDEKF